MNIEIISSSPRQGSLTHRVALHLQKHLSTKTQHNIGLIDVREWNLGLLQNVFSTIENTPEKYKPLAERVFAADAFIVVSPEYNGSYSPALNNLLDHFPKQARKPFGLVTASVGAMGGMRASQQLLLLVPGLFGIASPQLLVVPFIDKKFDVEGNLLDETFAKSIDVFATEFLWLAEKIKQ
ncbi:MAG: NAD(P)H-dependent oxidoreductase [Bacteroidetes bacterium]|jgi:NAD(P)H-dependent FMN reductase|nr:NAD(P)H-dependent oxidoreductase [Bacteroidota bacterium]